MKIWHATYTLNSPWHKGEHPGALLRLEFPGGQVGHADLHPWPELGEPILQELLGRLKLQQEHPLIARALQIAAEDAAARSRGTSLFFGQNIPASHKLLPSLEGVTPTDVQTWIEQGYRRFKVKMGARLTHETSDLRDLISVGTGLWRLDFNGRIGWVDFTAWWNEHGTWLAPHLDGIEDPVLPADTVALESILKESPEAFPKAALFEDRLNFEGAVGRVVKPEIQNYKPGAEKPRRLWVTNNLVHPFGHAVALAYAARWQSGEPCGLQGLDQYVATPGLKTWVDQIRYHGPVTLPPSGTGFGFDALLSKVAWKALT